LYVNIFLNNLDFEAEVVVNLINEKTKGNTASTIHEETEEEEAATQV